MASTDYVLLKVVVTEGAPMNKTLLTNKSVVTNTPSSIVVTAGVPMNKSLTLIQTVFNLIHTGRLSLYSFIQGVV